METQRYRELVEELATVTDLRERLELMLNLGEEVKNFDVDRAAQLAEEILVQARLQKIQQVLGKALCLKGFCLRLKSDYANGIAVLNDSLALAQKIKDRNIEAVSLYYLGNIYRDLGDFANVLLNYEKALIINEELGDEFHQSVILSSISNLLYDLNDFDSALEYALKCLPIFERAYNINTLLNIYNTLGNIYFKKEQFDEALYYFQENLNKSEPDTVAYVMAESGLGKVFFKMHRFDEARGYLLSSLREAQEIDNAEIQIICQYYLGKLYMEDGNYRQALQNLTAAFDLSDRFMRRHDLMSVHESLSALYDQMGDVPKAFHHLKSFLSLREELYKQKIIYELKNLQIRQQIELAQKEKEVAERTAALKHQFMANMSHEIRTPMNAIVGMTRLLLAKEPKPEQLKYLKAIQLSSDNLLVIINDILDLSKIEAGKITLEHTDFSLREIVNSVKDMLMLKAEEKKIGFNITIADAVPKKLLGDPTRLNQILINLAGNAVKFTNEGYVEILVTLQKTETKDDKNVYWINFDVADTGIGISPDYVDTIFESFTQAGTDIARRFGGTGLGLTISRQLTLLMNGDISLRSELGKGTTFTTLIPFEASDIQDDKDQDQVLDAAAMDRLNTLNVLLVEDNEFNRMVAEDTLKEALPGITIDIAVDGAEAVSRLKKDTYDVVLMDIHMPVMDGVTATRIIRSELSEPARSVKIIAMTANVMSEYVQQYLDAGMNEFVSKPFQVAELLLKIEATTRNNPPVAKPPVIEREIKKTDEPALPERITDMAFLKQFTGGNTAKMTKYIGMFLDNAPKQLAAIEKALVDKDYPAIKINAHSLKPQFGYMGVKEEYSNIFLIEQTAGESGQHARLPELIRHLHIVCAQAFSELNQN